MVLDWGWPGAMDAIRDPEVCYIGYSPQYLGAVPTYAGGRPKRGTYTVSGV